MAPNIKKVEKLGANDYIQSLEYREYQTDFNRTIYVMTVLQYCSANDSIRLSGPPRFFTKLIFQ